jgi:hypothetical protein
LKIKHIDLNREEKNDERREKIYGRRRKKKKKAIEKKFNRYIENELRS